MHRYSTTGICCLDHPRLKLAFQLPPHPPEHISAKAQVPPTLVQVGAEVIVPEYPELQAAAVQVPAKAVVAVPLEQLYPVGAVQATAGGDAWVGEYSGTRRLSDHILRSHLFYRLTRCEYDDSYVHSNHKSQRPHLRPHYK